MFQKIKEKLQENMHIIVVTVLTVYLIALTIKTGSVFYNEYWVVNDDSLQTEQIDLSNQAPR